MPLHVSSTCAHRQEVKIVLYSLWYHHTETSEWSKITYLLTPWCRVLLEKLTGLQLVKKSKITKITKITKIQFYKYEHILYFSNFSYFSNFRPLTCFSVMIPEAV